MIEKVISYRGCFVCGQDNACGLKLDFYFDHRTQKALAEFTPASQHEGYRHIVHGGIISSLLDEVMAKAILASGVPVVTSKLTVEFKKPAFVGQKLQAEGWITRQKGKAYFTAGRVLRSDGQVLAEGSGVYIRAEGELAEILGESREAG
ncbi:MAG: PaaI family thioesterase [Candidatus Saccharicenans sp.]